MPTNELLHVVCRVSDAHRVAVSELHEQIFGDLGESRLGLMKDLDEEAVECWTISLGNQVDGYCTIRKRSSTNWYISWMGIRKERRAMGLGKRLLESLISEANSTNVTHIELDTRNRFKEALCLYLGLGFDVAGTRLGLDNDLMIALRLGLTNTKL